MAQDLFLNQIVDKPTRGKSILDLLFTNRPNIFKKSDHLSGPGDHLVPLHTIILKPIFKKPAQRKIFLWSKADLSKIIESTQVLKSNFFKLFDKTSSVLDIWDYRKKLSILLTLMFLLR